MWHLWKGYLTCLLIFVLYGISPSQTQTTGVIHDGGLKKESAEASRDTIESKNVNNNKTSDSIITQEPPISDDVPKARSDDTNATTLQTKITTQTTAFVSQARITVTQPVQDGETSVAPTEATAGKPKPTTSKRTKPYIVITEKHEEVTDSTTQSTALPLTSSTVPTYPAGLSPIMMGIIAGVAVGFILIIIVIILIILFFVRRRRRSSKHDILMVENPQYRGPLAPPKPPRTANKYRFSRDSELYVEGDDGEEHKVTPRKKRRAPPPPPVALGPDGRPPIPSRTYSSRGSSTDQMPMTTFARKSSAPLAHDDDDVFEADSDEGNVSDDVAESGTRDPLLKNENKHSGQNGDIKEKEKDSKQDSQEQNNLKNSPSKSSVNWDDYDKENNPFFPG